MIKKKLFTILMITASFLWLIFSHAAVLLPIIIGFIKNKRRWATCSMVLFITSIFSSIYHWHEGGPVNIPSTSYQTFKSLDFFCSYLSVFLIVFYSINPKKEPEYLDVSLMAITIICNVITLIETTWYIFFVIVLTFCLIYKFICNNTNWFKSLKNIITNFFLFFIGSTTFILGMIMQYYFCYHNPSGQNYHIYHGFWHAFMFSSAGIWMLWNESIRTNKNIDTENKDINNGNIQVTEIVIL